MSNILWLVFLLRSNCFWCLGLLKPINRANPFNKRWMACVADQILCQARNPAVLYDSYRGPNVFLVSRNMGFRGYIYIYIYIYRAYRGYIIHIGFLGYVYIYIYIIHTYIGLILYTAYIDVIGDAFFSMWNGNLAASPYVLYSISGPGRLRSTMTRRRLLARPRPPQPPRPRPASRASPPSASLAQQPVCPTQRRDSASDDEVMSFQVVFDCDSL